eukprot:CAMPEP_0117685550 /NCGR_PEP_ID=MMETSP0804-20121206/21835_1 /TAXON_ID=1074897 /ORGANISM="Tetraselmis astigmatica, Strain CCMP880" /LENGTH=223 /DNA_ID=CAMNT_0005496901 /DNA_START=430 /DNA_END=1101 /DNA_ORIENTATION=-
MEWIAAAVVLLALVLGLIHLFARPAPQSAGEVKASAAKKKKTKKKTAAAKSTAADRAPKYVPAEPVAEAGPVVFAAEASCGGEEVASREESEAEEADTNFLGLDDVLPASRGVYAVEGTADYSADTLLDGWETVDPTKYNIPKGSKINAQGLHVSQPQDTARPTNKPPAGVTKSRNDRRREKQQAVRDLQMNTVGASVAERIGSAGTKRVQKEPSVRNTVPGM